MSLTLIATPGAADANSYATVDEADAYHEGRVHVETWTDADETEEKTPALVQATALLDQWFEWEGETASAEQALLWPRVGVTGANGYLVASDSIPARIRDAAAELARQLIDADRTADSDTETQGIKRVKAGSVEVEFAGAGGSKPIPDAVVALVGPLGRLTGRGGSGGVQLFRA